MRRWAIINVFLALIVALLGVQIARTWARALPAIEVTPRAPAGENAPPAREKSRRGGEKGVARAHQPPETLVAAIAEKDLFDPSRRAPSEESKPAEVVKETGPPPGITVVGVRIFGGDREVFVTDTTQGAAAQRRLRVGDDVGGYTVKTIEATSVTLSSPSGDLVNMPLALEKGKATAGTPTPRAAGRTPAQPAGSPAAGAQGASPAAGVARTPPAVPVPPAPGVPAPPGVVPPRAGQNPPNQQLPAEVRQKLERLKRGDKNPRMGEKQ
jgi:hypothetical protein